MDAALKPTILTYHSVSTNHPPLSIAPDVFAEQMIWLSRNARVESLDAVVDRLKERKTLPPRTVVLTFDDGYQDFYTAVAPELRKFGFPATVFLPTAYCGRTSSWAGQPSWMENKMLLTWREIEELAGQGIHFGAHTVTHRDLCTLSLVDAAQELLESKREIERRTGKPADFFCYPYGRWSPAVRSLVARSFRGGCSTAAGVVNPDADPFVLPRVDAHYVRTAACFHSLFTRRFLGYVALRRIIRRFRNQPEGFYSRI